MMQSMSIEQPSMAHLVRLPETNGVAETNPPLLILLHGVRSNEQDLFALIPYLDERFIVISARALFTMGRNQFGWYHVAFYADRIDRNEAELEQSRKLLVQFIDEAVAKYGADPRRVYLMGFSQGSIMSLAVMLTQPELLAGVVVQSGSLPREVLPIAAAPERLKDFPVLVVHGLYDEVLPIAEGRAVRDHLNQLPVKLDYREYPMRHQISDQSLDDVCGWLIAQLNRA
jgi:phospholipase/carboxylesterase